VSTLEGKLNTSSAEISSLKQTEEKLTKQLLEKESSNQKLQSEINGLELAYGL